MRSVWNGSISFGLVSIPVKTYSATDRTSSVSFVRIHDKDGGRIRYRKFCELDGEEVPNEEIGKGYPASDDAIVPITDDDLSRLPLPTARTLTILSFVDPGEIDPLQLDKSYYLGPDGLAAAKPYTLLREALEHHEKVAIGKVAMHGRETLAMLRAHDGAIVMHALLWPDQIRPTKDVVPDDVEIRPNELTLAEVLMDSLGELDPAELHDDYREAVEQLVAAKVAGGEPGVPEAGAASGAKVIDLMAALENSVRAAKEGRGEYVGAAGSGADSPPASVTPIRGRKTARTTKTVQTAKTAKRSAAPAAAGKSGTRKTTVRKATTAESGPSGTSGPSGKAAGATTKTATAKKSTATSDTSPGTTRTSAAKRTTGSAAGKAAGKSTARTTTKSTAKTTAQTATAAKTAKKSPAKPAKKRASA
ncbi:Ku protein [Streptomyces celluloflavus]|uniref:non-homologous end joining protein Ku n=1 Tax=Streptomyces celluloflavus TaxID=58344 RepID=UPI003461603C|nr:Ku protein [Streptomyces celluloflavus]